MSEFHTAAELAEFILCDGGHDGKAKLRVFIDGFDVVVLEEDGNTGIQQITGVLDGIQCVTGKAGAAGADALAETGKGFSQYITVVGLCETVALFALVFSMVALG